LACPIRSIAYIARFLEAKTTTIQTLLEGVTQVANTASPSLPIRQALSYLMRSRAAQKCGHLFRAIPPEHTEDFARDIDGLIVQATTNIFRLEGLGMLQRDLFLCPLLRVAGFSLRA
jgi:hypothetical protein